MCDATKASIANDEFAPKNPPIFASRSSPGNAFDVVGHKNFVEIYLNKNRITLYLSLSARVDLGCIINL